METRIKMLGGAEVDGNAALVMTDELNLLVDYGMIMGESDKDKNKIAVHKIPEGINIDFVLLTHAHLDHSGGIVEILKKHPNCKVVCSEPTLVFAEKLLSNVYGRISYYKPIVSKNLMFIEPLTSYKLSGKCWATFIPNGHIRGSGSVILKINEKTVMFSGDISDQDLPTVDGFKVKNFEDINPDILFLESTYGNQNFPSRESEIDKIVEKIKQTHARGGNVIIPAFALGRAQDIAMALAKYNIHLSLDGMTIPMARLMADGSLLWGNDQIMKLTDYPQINFVPWTDFKNCTYKEKREFFARQRQGIMYAREKTVISSAGWCQGGRSTLYLKHWLENENNAVFFPGPYQRDVAKIMLEPNTKWIQIPDPEDKSRNPKNKVMIILRKGAQVEKFFLSSHADQNGLVKFAETVRPKNIILYHGDPEAKEALKEKTARIALTKIAGNEDEIIL